MAHTTSAKAKSPVHQQKFKSIKHEQVLVDNAVEDVVNRAWFESAISNVFPKQEFESAISNAFPKQKHTQMVTAGIVSTPNLWIKSSGSLPREVFSPRNTDMSRNCFRKQLSSHGCAREQKC